MEASNVVRPLAVPLAVMSMEPASAGMSALHISSAIESTDTLGPLCSSLSGDVA